MTTRIAASFSKAHDYDTAARIQPCVAADLAERIAAHMALQPPRRILEIGCGTGGLTRHLARLFPEAEIIATDVSPGMLTRAAANPGLEHVRFQAMDGEHPDVAGKFDLICSSLCVQWFADLGFGLARLAALLAPEGQLHVSTLAAGSFAQWRACCAAEQVASGFPDYPDSAALAALLPGAVWDRLPYDDHPASALEFLRDLKRIGAATPRADFVPHTAHHLRRIMAHFDAGDRVMTYDVAFASFKKTATSPRGVFVTGTDTGIGKTLVSAILARAWNAHYWKPLQTGLAEEQGDTPTVATLSSAPCLPPAYALAQPLAPLAAAQAEGIEIAPERLAIPEHGAGPLVIEGAGGLMVPITPTLMMIDLIAAYAMPVVLVARSTLGTLNHTLLSLEALRRRGIPVAGLVLSGPPNPGNAQALRQFGNVRILAKIPLLEAVTPDSVGALAAGIPALDEVLESGL